MTLVEILKGATCWEDIHARIKLAPNTKAQGDLFEQFCRLFLLERGDFEEVWLQKDFPYQARTSPHLGGGDHGVDLLTTEGGGYVGIQCKWRSADNAKLYWGKDKLTHLLAHEDLPPVIFSNAVSVDEYTLQRMELRTILYADLSELNEHRIKNMLRIIADEKPKPEPKRRPRPHQKEAISKIVAGFETAERGQLILPCGAGKTLTALWVKEAMQPKRTIVLVPSLALLRQTKDEWRKQRSTNFDYMCVCSESGIDSDDYDSPVTNIAEIGSAGIGVFTNSADIKRELNTRQAGEVVVFATYQSSDKLRGIKFDLAICDEAHKTTGTNQSSYFANIHKNAQIPCTKRLYMTATPRILINRKDSTGDNDIISEYASMDNKRIFGSEFYRMSFKQAIDQDILCDYKVVVVIADHPTADKARGRAFAPESLHKIYKETADKYGVKKTITFHSRIRQADEFSATLRSKFVDAELVTGKQTTSQRKRILDDFAQGNISVVTNARCLTEGVDVPATDMIYFCNQRTSKVDIVQAAGRALRTAEGKKFGYILVPILHHSKSEIGEQIEKGTYEGNFEQVIRVLRALQDHDERLADEIHERHLKKYKELESSILQIANFADLAEVDLTGVEIDPYAYIFRKSTRSKFLMFNDARAFVRDLGLKTMKEWGEYSSSDKRPNSIPSAPHQTYKNRGWNGYGDWLGTGNIRNKEFLQFEEARKFARGLNLRNTSDWQGYAKSGEKPDNIPSNPQSNYKNRGWNGYGDWLGTDSAARVRGGNFRPFVEARLFVHSLGLQSAPDWKEYMKSDERPLDIPTNPQQTYKNDGWISWADWLGTTNIRTVNWHPFEGAREFARSLGLSGKREWAEYSKSGKRPADIPSSPHTVYKNKGWISWADWLGAEKEWLSFEKARKFVHGLNLKIADEWWEYTKSGERSENIPAHPQRTYKNSGWVSWSDWIGTGKPARQKYFRPYLEARTFIRSLRLSSQKEWQAYMASSKKPADIPSNPHTVYKNAGWDGLHDWLGTTNIRTVNWRPFEEARVFVRSLGISGQKEWNEYSKSGKRPEDIPSNPNIVYKNKGWQGMRDWLGIATKIESEKAG